MLLNWLRPVNNYKIIIIQSHHWTQLKESEKQITISPSYKLKGQWDESEIMFKRNNKEIAGFFSSINSNNDVFINPLYKLQVRILISENSLDKQIHICNLLLQRFK